MSAKSKTVNIRVLNTRADGADRLIRVALVSDIVDSYQTVFHVRGCVSPLESVPIDWLHNRVATECAFEPGSEAIETIEVPDGSGGTIEAEAKVADIRVPQSARKWTRSNKDLEPDEVASLYDAVDRGQVRWGSIDFDPIEIVQYRDAKGNLIREEYPKWRLNYFSLLDVKPGQDTSYVLNIRSKNRNKNMLEINSRIRFLDSPAEIVKADEETNKYTLRVAESEFDVDAALVEAFNKRAWVKCVLKRKSDGLLGVITEQTSTTTAKGISTETNTVKTVDGGTFTVDGSKISWADYEDDDIEWVYAEMGDIILYVMESAARRSAPETTTPPAADAPTDTPTTPDAGAGEDEGDDAGESELERMKAENARLKEENDKFNAVHQRLLNSPEAPKPTGDSDPAVDPVGDIGEGADSNQRGLKQKEDEAEKQRRLILEREYPAYSTDIY